MAAARLRPALLLLGLALSAPALAAPKDKKPPAPDPIAAMLEARASVFGPIDAAFKEGRKAEVADLLVELVAKPEHAAYHAEGWSRLGAVLESLDLPFSALLAYERALSTDAPLVADAAGKAIKLADKVGDTAVLEGVFAKNLGLEVSAETRSRMAYLAAREATHRGQHPLALASLKMVATTDPFYPEAKALEGVSLSVSGRHNDALGPLQVAMGAGQAYKRGARFDDMVKMNLARAYYAAGNFPRAIEYYAQINRSSRSWPQAQFERAWAHFRLGDPNGSLSLLFNHQTTFLDELYAPEADLLRMYSYFQLCKFPEATKSIDALKGKYKPRVTLLRETAALGPQELFARHAALIEGKPAEVSPLVSYFFVEEDRLRDSLAAVRSAEDEIKRLKNVAANPFSAWATEAVSARRANLIDVEGKRIQTRVTRMADELQSMLDAADLSRLDMMDMEKRLYMQAANTGEMAKSREVVQRGKSVKKNERLWPYEGELWADELGYYRIQAKPDCPAGFQP
jgi:tetratricopeptide (TPR) repeat protein